MKSILQKLTKTLPLAVFIFIAASMPPKPVQAQLATVCVNCSTVIQQIREYVHQLLQYAKQLEEYSKQVEQYKNQMDRLKLDVKNTVSLATSHFDDALSTIRSIENTMANARNISYTWSNLDSNFRQQFKDVYEEYNRIHNLRDSSAAIQNDFDRAERTYDSALSALKVARSHSTSLQADQHKMDVVGWQLMGAEGRLDAIQAAGEYAQLSAQQLMKMRHLAMVQLQLMSQVQADEEQRRISEAAATKVFTDRKPTPAFPNGFTPN